MNKPVFLLCIIPLWAAMLSGTCSPSYGEPKEKSKGNKMSYEVQKSEEEWKKVLTSDQYRILREKGTERAFTGEYYYNKEKESIYARPAERNFSIRIRSTSQVADGLPFINRQRKKGSYRKRILAME